MESALESKIQLEKIERAASAASDVIARAAATAKDVINQAAANAISTLTTAAAVQSRDIEYIKDGMNRINLKLDSMDNRFASLSAFSILERRTEDIDKNTPTLQEFTFWRNVLISGLLCTIFIGVVVNFITR